MRHRTRGRGEQELNLGAQQRRERRTYPVVWYVGQAGATDMHEHFSRQVRLCRGTTGTEIELTRFALRERYKLLDRLCG